MGEYGKHFFLESVKRVAYLFVGALLVLGWNNWQTSDLEYRQGTKNGYLHTSLGQQGLTMAYEGKPLKNISVVEFTIFNRTSRQFSDVDLLFSVVGPESQMTLVSSGIIPPHGLPHSETVEELPVKDTRTKKFRLKVIPKQHDTDYFDAVFVFDGEKAPSMSVVSLSKDVSIGAYREWKDTIKALARLLIIIVFLYTITFSVPSLLKHFFGPRHHRKFVKRFLQHAAKLREQGELKSTDEQAIADASKIYASFTLPKTNKLWSKIFGAQHFDY